MQFSLQDYLKQYPDAKEITLLGPMDCEPGALSEPLILVDGGARHATPGLGVRVGDGDSSLHPMDHYLDKDKDMSDLAYVLDNLPHTLERLRLCGFLGGRRDHEMFNFGEIHRFLKGRSGPVRVTFDDQTAAYSQGRWEFEHHGLFSLATVEPCRVTLGGACRYPIPEPRTVNPLSSLGLSNEGHGIIFVHSDGPVFILCQEDETP